MKVRTGFVLLVVLGVVAAGFIFSGVFEPDYDTSIVDESGFVADDQLLARGKYLARAADCAACHTAENGAPFAGGVPIATPFGTIHGTNITPDPDYGIGKWTSADLYKVLRNGVTPSHVLYPAMPYASYRGIRRADSDAIFVYLKSLEPVPETNQKNTVPFPFSIRPLVRGWNLLFLKDELPAASEGDSELWVRGRYLVNVLGHCAECHTPRGVLGQMQLKAILAGGDAEAIHAPDIRPVALAARGWQPADLRQFLAEGIAPQGSTYGSMYEAFHLSTRYLSEPDNQAVVTYLTGDRVREPAPLAALGTESVVGPGREQYLAMCAGCHGAQGQGKPNITVALAGNSTVRNADAHNLLQVMLYGLDKKEFPNFQGRQAMPGFADLLDDTQLADLANYLRLNFGGQKGDIQTQAVAALR